MKFLTLALLLAGFSVCTLQAAEQQTQAAVEQDDAAAKDKKLRKCVSSKGSIKNGKCMRKGQELQAYSYK